MEKKPKRTWADLETWERAQQLAQKSNEMMAGLTPYERECMRKVHMAEADGKPIDPVAKRVIDDAVDRFNAEWKREREEYGV